VPRAGGSAAGIEPGPTLREKHRLAGETGASLPTINKWLRDVSSVHAAYAYALERGCEKLCIKVERDKAAV